MRNFNAHLIAPIMRITGFRFSKAYRHEVTRFHSVVYRCVSTVGANYLADGDAWDWF